MSESREHQRIEELEEALRGLIACHGMKPAPNCGFLLRAREILADADIEGG